MSDRISSPVGRTPRLAVLVLLLIIAAEQAAGQGLGNTFGGFQTLSADPRVRALGEATVALSGTAGAPGHNPAAIGESGHVRVGTNITLNPLNFSARWIGNSSLSIPSLDFKSGAWAGALQYNSLRWSQAQRSGKVAVAYDALPSLRVGGAVSVIDSEFITRFSKPVRAVSFDVGLLYLRAFKTRWGSVGASAGWSLTDFGKPVQDDVGKLPLATVMRGGAALQASSNLLLVRRPLWSAGLYGALSKNMIRFDLENGRPVPHGPFRALFTSWKPIESPSHEALSLGVWDQINRHVGLEVVLWDALFIRNGYFHEHEYNGARQYRSAGIGIDLYYAVLDYSTVVTRDTALKGVSFWRLTTRIPLQCDPANFWPDLLREIRKSALARNGDQ